MTTKRILTLISASFCFVTVLWCLSYVLISNRYESLSVQGQFGDTFGAVNALFSGLAFAGLLITIFLQQHEINEQRRNNQVERLDVMFTALLNFHHAQLDKLSFKGESGRPAFTMFVKSLSFHTNYFDDTEASFSKYVSVFTNYYNQHKSRFDFYIQSLNGIRMKIFESSFLTDSERSGYLDILASQVSYPERQFLFYYIALYNKHLSGDHTTRYFCEELNLLNLSPEELLDQSHRKLDKFFSSEIAVNLEDDNL